MLAFQHELLGVRGFAMQLRIEQAGVMDDLNCLVVKISEAVAKRHGLAVAMDFLQDAERFTNQNQALQNKVEQSYPRLMPVVGNPEKNELSKLSLIRTRIAA